MTDFKLEEKIAQGGFGEVWRGIDPKRGETIAVKFLRLDRAGPGFLGLFKREFEILSEIRHVHLARVFDFGFDPERNLYYFTQEYCPGASLKQAMENRSGFEGFEEILVQILSSLDYIHSQGIIHFDIKPDNIIVERTDGEPRARLVDFGISARLNVLSGGRGGTLAYMAPELFQKNAAIDHRIDLYSLGMTCLEVLCGGYPFDMDDAETVIAWHQKGTVPPEMWGRAGLPRYLREILEKLLSKKPSERFSSAKVVLNFLNLSTGRKYLKEEEGLLGQIPTEGPLVERREEVIAPLLEALKTSGVIAVSGEKGMGKSRVLDEIRYALELKEIPICRIEGDWQEPAWPKLSSWLGLVPLPESELTEEWRIARRIDAALEAARTRPFCLLVDDAHKADAEMKAFLKGLAQRAEKGPLPGLTAVVATEEIGDAEASPFRLKRITEKGVAQYMRLVLGDAADAQGSIAVKRLAGLLYAYSGGLPLLMVEGLKFLAPHFARGESLESLMPPPEVADLYKPAMDSLSPVEKDVVLVAALVFRPVPEDELAIILERPVSDVLHDAATCARKGLLAEGFGGGNPVRVSSQALSLGIIRSLNSEDRAAIHRRIARGLQSIPGSSDREVAYHLSKSGETGQAARYYREAAKAFKENGQISAATDSLIRAIQCVGESSEAGEELILEAVRALILSGEYTEAAMYLKKLEERPSIERHELSGWLAFKQRRFGEAREYYARALQSLPAGDQFRRIHLENSLANVDLQEGHPFEASVRFRKTRDWEAKLEPAERVKVSNNNLGLALSLMGDLAAAEGFYRERLLQRSGGMNPAEELTCLSGLGYVLLQSSRYEEAVALLTRATDIAERTGTFHSLFSCAGNLVTALLKEGRYAESLSHLLKTAAYQQRLGTLRDVAYNLLRQGDVYLTLGMGEAAHDAFQRGQKAALESGQSMLVAWFLLMEGYWQREFGERETAKQLFLQTELEAAKISQEDLVTWAAFALADLSCDAGEMDECRRHLERIVPIKGDLEFAARMELLELKAHPEVPNRDARYEALEKTCREGHLRELLWELYEAWGKAEKADGRPARALQRFEQGVASIEAVAASLPEEYRDRYIHCGGRRRIQEAFRELEGHARPTIGEKIKHFFHLH